MATSYQRILAVREDMTDWLIHFTRDREKRSARDNLLQILAEGLLRPGWAIRPRAGATASTRTVYGPNSAVCFTEQPIGALLEYVRVRPMAEPFGVIVHKHDAFADGALPVIYGLHDVCELKPGDEGYVAGQRTLDPLVISLQQQHRYVALAFNRAAGPVDWTHEREWRWAAIDPTAGIDDCFALGGSGSACGRGVSLGHVHIFVQKEADKGWLRDNVAAAVARVRAVRATSTSEDKRYHAMLDRWTAWLAEGAHVFSLEELERELRRGNRDAYRVETWLPSHAHYAIL